MKQPRKLNTGSTYGESGAGSSAREQGTTSAAGQDRTISRSPATTYTGRARSRYSPPTSAAQPHSRYQPQTQNTATVQDPYQVQYQNQNRYQYDLPNTAQHQNRPPVQPAQTTAAELQDAETSAQPAPSRPAQQVQQSIDSARSAQKPGYTPGANTLALEQEQIAAARRRAQQLASQNAKRRVVQQPVRSGQLSRAQQEAAAHAEAARRAAADELAAARHAAEAQSDRPLTRAQKQALAYRQATEQKYGDTASFNPPRTVRETQQEQLARRVAAKNRKAVPTAQVRELDLRNTAPQRQNYNYNNDPAYQAAMDRMPEGESAQFAVPGTPAAAAGAGGGKPPRDTAPAPQTHSDGEKPAAPPRAAKGKGKKPADTEKKATRGKKGSGPQDGNGKKPKKKGGCLIIGLVTLLIIALILGGAYALILHAIAPDAGAISLNQLLNTPKEFQDDEFNFVMIGVDRATSGELSAGASNDNDVNDGNTDMILYVHYNNVTGEMSMLQIPRDTIVTTDRSVSANYRINNVAMTQADGPNSLNIPALCQTISDMYQVPVDGYIVIRLEMLVDLVDTFGGLELNVPMDMVYEGSELHAGYQTLNGAACEFLLRARKIYPDGDIGRLNMQRQFYSGLFRKLKSIGNIWDVAKLTPVVLNHMTTDISASKLVSFAVSMLKVDSSKIMICQMPVKMAENFNGEAVVYPARTEDADLLNLYFRENTGPVDAASLQLVDGVGQIGFDLANYPATDANVQRMSGLNEEANNAQQNANLDGSMTVVVAEPTPIPADETHVEDTENNDAAESQSAAQSIR